MTNIEFLKVNPIGNLIWTNLFNDEHRISSCWSLQKSIDNNLLSSFHLIYFDKFGSYPQVTKFDQEGNVMWDYQGTEEMEVGGFVYMTELSDSNIVVNYRLEGNQSHDYRFLWLDKNGEYMNEIFVESILKDELLIANMETGKGDYFFTYGRYSKDDPDDLVPDIEYGMITKYNNQGDTIWAHWYQHPQYEGNRKNHYIYDIVELDNGDIWALGEIQDYDGDNVRRVWVFKINEFGCMEEGVNDCVTITSSIDNYLLNDDLKIIPNPTEGIFYLQTENIDQIKKVEIFDFTGKMKTAFYNPVEKMNISNFPSGVYMIRAYLKNGSWVNKKVLKINE